MNQGYPTRETNNNPMPTVELHYLDGVYLCIHFFAFSAYYVRTAVTVFVSNFQTVTSI